MRFIIKKLLIVILKMYKNLILAIRMEGDRNE